MNKMKNNEVRTPRKSSEFLLPKWHDKQRDYKAMYFKWAIISVKISTCTNIASLLLLAWRCHYQKQRIQTLSALIQFRCRWSELYLSFSCTSCVGCSAVRLRKVKNTEVVIRWYYNCSINRWCMMTISDSKEEYLQSYPSFDHWRHSDEKM